MNKNQSIVAWVDMKKVLITSVIITFSFLQLGCARGSYARQHPYKTAFVTLGVAAAIGLIAYAASKSGGGGSSPSTPQNNYVDGYYKADGTYVRPHYRTYPDDFIDNNYGLPSPQQAEQFKNYRVLPTYLYDFDSDGITNQYDVDDDNDGCLDNYDKAPYNPSYR
jgi:hypothetical protein